MASRHPWAGSLALAAAALLAFVAVVLVAQRSSPVPPPEIATTPPTSLPIPTPVPPQPEPPRDLPLPTPPAPQPPPPVAPQPPPVPPPVPTPVPAVPAPAVETPVEKPPVPTAPEKKTVAVVATLERVHGDVTLIGEALPVPAKAGIGLIPGMRLGTAGRASSASLKISDGSSLLLTSDTVLVVEGARAFNVFKGTVHADIVRQPAGQAMNFTTPTAQAKVLGTELTLNVTPASTRLEVREGKVRMTRPDDGSWVDVSAGNAAVATKGAPMVSKPARAFAGLQALYLFDEGQGNVIHDLSAAGAPLDLRITRPASASWTPAGLNVTGNTRLDSDAPAARLIDACRKSQELTIEAWIQPSRPALDFEGAIVALSTDVEDRNFSLVQGDAREGMNLYAVAVRTSATNAGGTPELFTPKASTETKLTHFVFTRDARGAERIWVNGFDRGHRLKPGTFAPWNDAFRLILANESTEERPWAGSYRLVALYSRALAPADVARNLKAGVD